MNRRKVSSVERFEQWVKVAAGRLDAIRRSMSATGAHALPHLPKPNLPVPHAPASVTTAPGGLKARLSHTVAPAQRPVAPAAQAAPAAPPSAPISPRERMAMLKGKKAPGPGPREPVPDVGKTQALIGNNNIFRSGATERALAGPAKPSPFASGRQVVAPPQSIMKPTQEMQANMAETVRIDPSRAADQNRFLALDRISRHASEGSDGAVMRKTTFATIPIFIETDVGQARKWKDPKSGEERATIMRFPYGYIPDTEGMDDGSVDVFLGPVSDAPNAYVILINKPPTFEAADEEKVFLGFTNIYDAIGAFLQHYGNQEKFIRKVSVIPVTELAKSLLEDKVTGTAEGSTKTDTRVKHEPELATDPTSRMVEALEEPSAKDDVNGDEDDSKPDIDEDAVKKVASYFREKIASEMHPAVDEDLVKEAAAYLTAKIASDLRPKVAAEPASTSIPGFAPSTSTIESAGPEDLKVSPCVPDNTIWHENDIENMFRNVESNAMQTDHMVDPGQITSTL
jgi:hypothetical protein